MENNDIALGRILEALERGKNDREEMIAKLDGINFHLIQLNGRTGKLEDDSKSFKSTVEQVGRMSDTFQIVHSAINTLKSWGWRLALLFAITLVVGNQAATRIFDLMLKWLVAS